MQRRSRSHGAESIVLAVLAVAGVLCGAVLRGAESNARASWECDTWEFGRRVEVRRIKGTGDPESQAYWREQVILRYGELSLSVFDESPGGLHDFELELAPESEDAG
ncbi:hypothetical protein [Nannocystis radixulma]|uniref:Uncharacterized protein n=1 Tax=Nannocystis radixulma TaxID=2995305 RepID=A0ABT5AYR3_9BACT|nr:hypothetical protein [Nannocystis radixulma]MDC0666419.1 hypothetical protein [Nannocystis radixulma]